MIQVTKNIYQASEATARQVLASGQYKQHGIKGVICPAFNVRIVTPADLSCLIMPIDDYDDLPVAWLKAAAAFYHAFKPVLVHCRGGKNRSVAVAAALAWYDGKSPYEIYSQLNRTPTRELAMSVDYFINNT